MAIYEYQCGSCSKQFELLVRSSTVVACPFCESRQLEQLLSEFAVSSQGTRDTNLQGARRQISGSTNYRDQKKAESESYTRAVNDHH